MALGYGIFFIKKKLFFIYMQRAVRLSAGPRDEAGRKTSGPRATGVSYFIDSLRGM